MAEAKWVKFVIGMFDDPKLKIINSMENRDCICYVWVRSIMLAGLCNRNGFLCINDNIPYSLETISIIFDRPVQDVKKAFEVLMSLEMIEKTEDGIFHLKNWARHQNTEGLEKLKRQNAERVARYRRRKKAQNSEGSCEEGKIEYDSEGHENDEDDIMPENVSIITNDKTESFEEDYKEKEQNKNCNDMYKDVCNAECNDSVQNVMIQKKRENKKEDKDYKERERDKDFAENKSVEKEVEELAHYFMNLTGKKKNINTEKIKYAVLKHGAEYVKLAMDKACESGKSSFSYANGILSNWAKEGYPNLNMGEGLNGGRFVKENSTDNKNQFSGVKKKKPRELTESEKQESELI